MKSEKFDANHTGRKMAGHGVCDCRFDPERHQDSGEWESQVRRPFMGHGTKKHAKLGYRATRTKSPGWKKDVAAHYNINGDSLRCNNQQSLNVSINQNIL